MLCIKNNNDVENQFEWAMQPDSKLLHIHALLFGACHCGKFPTILFKKKIECETTTIMIVYEIPTTRFNLYDII